MENKEFSDGRAYERKLIRDGLLLMKSKFHLLKDSIGMAPEGEFGETMIDGLLTYLKEQHAERAGR